jgi:hypothetical protein
MPSLPLERLRWHSQRVGDTTQPADRGAALDADRHGPSPRSNRVGRAFALVGIVGPLFYIVLVVVLGLLWQGYDPIRQRAHSRA